MSAKEEVNAKKDTHDKRKAIALLKDVSELYAARGKKVVHVKLTNTDLSQAEIMKLILGPTGNLRAPTLRKGKTLIVGFHEETYEKFFG